MHVPRQSDISWRNPFSEADSGRGRNNTAADSPSPRRPREEQSTPRPNTTLAPIDPIQYPESTVREILVQVGREWVGNFLLARWPQYEGLIRVVGTWTLDEIKSVARVGRQDGIRACGRLFHMPALHDEMASAMYDELVRRFGRSSATSLQNNTTSTAAATVAAAAAAATTTDDDPAVPTQETFEGRASNQMPWGSPPARSRASSAFRGRRVYRRTMSSVSLVLLETSMFFARRGEHRSLEPSPRTVSSKFSPYTRSNKWGNGFPDEHYSLQCLCGTWNRLPEHLHAPSASASLESLWAGLKQMRKNSADGATTCHSHFRSASETSGSSRSSSTDFHGGRIVCSNEECGAAVGYQLNVEEEAGLHMKMRTRSVTM